MWTWSLFCRKLGSGSLRLKHVRLPVTWKTETLQTQQAPKSHNKHHLTTQQNEPLFLPNYMKSHRFSVGLRFRPRRWKSAPMFVVVAVVPERGWAVGTVSTWCRFGSVYPLFSWPTVTRYHFLRKPWHKNRSTSDDLGISATFPGFSSSLALMFVSEWFWT